MLRAVRWTARIIGGSCAVVLFEGHVVSGQPVKGAYSLVVWLALAVSLVVLIATTDPVLKILTSGERALDLVIDAPNPVQQFPITGATIVRYFLVRDVTIKSREPEALNLISRLVLELDSGGLAPIEQAGGVPPEFGHAKRLLDRPFAISPGNLRNGDLVFSIGGEKQEMYLFRGDYESAVKRRTNSNDPIAHLMFRDTASRRTVVHELTPDVELNVGDYVYPTTWEQLRGPHGRKWLSWPSVRKKAKRLFGSSE